MQRLGFFYSDKLGPLMLEDLEIVDFGVSDNVYVVASKLFEAQQKKIATIEAEHLKVLDKVKQSLDDEDNDNYFLVKNALSIINAELERGRNENSD